MNTDPNQNRMMAGDDTVDVPVTTTDPPQWEVTPGYVLRLTVGLVVGLPIIQVVGQVGKRFGREYGGESWAFVGYCVACVVFGLTVVAVGRTAVWFVRRQRK